MPFEFQANMYNKIIIHKSFMSLYENKLKWNILLILLLYLYY